MLLPFINSSISQLTCLCLSLPTMLLCLHRKIHEYLISVISSIPVSPIIFFCLQGKQVLPLSNNEGNVVHTYRSAKYLLIFHSFLYTKTVIFSDRFEAWKACLGVLGIPFFDVVRVLAAVLLLGNVTFIEGQGLEVDIQGGSHELKVCASLLYYLCGMSFISV